MRWNLLKGHFSRAIEKGERISKSREKGVATPFLGTPVERYNHHIDYIHWNPVKHGWVTQVSDWQYSSFHRFVAQDIYPANWGCKGVFDIYEGKLE